MNSHGKPVVAMKGRLPRALGPLKACGAGQAMALMAADLSVGPRRASGADNQSDFLIIFADFFVRAQLRIDRGEHLAHARL
jgi:hypothetical protein